MNPNYIKGHLSFVFEDRNIEYIHQSISTFGVSGLPWDSLNPTQHFGLRVTAAIRIATLEQLAFETPATITREISLTHQKMGLAFELNSSQKEKLQSLISRAGFTPTHHIRKFPRIPSSELIRSFPLRSIVTPRRLLASSGDVLEAQPMVFDVENLSPNGVLLKSESQAANILMPGDRISFTLEPRGSFPTPISAGGTVCRILDSIHPKTGNPVRRIGVKLTQINELNRQAFLDLMRDILATLKRPT